MAPRKTPKKLTKKANNVSTPITLTKVTPQHLQSETKIKMRKMMASHNMWKIELANEVAQTALVKKTAPTLTDRLNHLLSDSAEASTSVCNSTQINAMECDSAQDSTTINDLAQVNTTDRKRRGRPKKTKIIELAEDPMKDTPQKVLKTATKQPTRNKKKVPKVEETNTGMPQKAPIKKAKQPLQRKTKVTKIEKSKTPGKVISRSTSKRPPKPVRNIKKQIPLNTNKRSVTRKSKSRDDVTVDDVLCSYNNSPLSILAREMKTEAKETPSRRTTISMNDSISWIRDISSSSTTTCLSIASNDLVSIDNKIPVIELSKIDNRVINYGSNVKLPENITNQSQRCSFGLGLPETENISNQFEKYRPGFVIPVTGNASIDSDSSSSESSDSSPEKSSSDTIYSTRSVNLSTSCSTESNYKDTPNVDRKLKEALDKIAANLQKVDRDINKWIGLNDEDIDTLLEENGQSEDEIFSGLKEENEILNNLRKIREIFDEDCNSPEHGIDEIAMAEIHEQPPEDVCLAESVSLTSDKNSDQHTHVDGINELATSNKASVMSDVLNENCNENEAHEICTTEAGDNTTSKIVTVENNEDGEACKNDESTTVVQCHNNNNVDYNDDYDDDALSLFAESIDISRMDANDFEEYVLEPPARVPVACNYNPSKITPDTNSAENCKVKSICEKQTADSTSAFKDIQRTHANNASKYTVDNQTSNCVDSENTNNSRGFEYIDSDNTHHPRYSECNNFNNPACDEKKNSLAFIILSKKTKPKFLKTQLFKGVCFFYLTSNCKKSRCAYDHVPVENFKVQQQLPKYSLAVLIEEYFIFRQWPALRNKLVLIFLKEFQNRDMTRLSIEVMVDYMLRMNPQNEAQVLQSLAESTLEHLDRRGLVNIYDLLLYQLRDGSLVCDVLIEIIAESQNFSRFKNVFSSLTKFMVDSNRTFSLKTTQNILDRVAVLPCDELVAGTFIKILGRTDGNVFNSPMMEQYEKQLNMLDVSVINQYVSMKELITQKERSKGTPEKVASVRSPVLSDHLMAASRERNSPDTTKVDVAQKPPDPPEKNIYSGSPNQSMSSEDSPTKNKPKFKTYKPDLSIGPMFQDPNFIRPPSIRPQHRFQGMPQQRYRRPLPRSQGRPQMGQHLWPQPPHMVFPPPRLYFGERYASYGDNTPAHTWRQRGKNDYWK